MTQSRRFLLLLGPLLLGAALQGCANDRSAQRADARTVPAAAELAQARASLAEAEQTGAIEFGAPQLALAREKLSAAEEAAGDGDAERAHRLAVEADLDANLAVAITRRRETQELVAEVRDSMRALEREADRSVDQQLPERAPLSPQP